MKKEYAVYKGENILTMGTAEECSKELNVSKEYIVWMTMPSYKRRLSNRKHPEKCTAAFEMEDEVE